MQMPTVATTGKDSKNDITYRVMAYRVLQPAEVQFAVHQYLLQHKKPKRGTMVQIVTLVGLSD